MRWPLFAFYFILGLPSKSLCTTMHHVLDILKMSSPPIICGKSMISNNAANYAANIKDTFIDTRSCASAKLPSQARARGESGSEEG